MDILAKLELFQSLEFLDTIFCKLAPTLYLIRFTNTASFLYEFINTSGRGFRGSFETIDRLHLDINLRVWSSSVKSEESLN